MKTCFIAALLSFVMFFATFGAISWLIPSSIQKSDQQTQLSLTSFLSKFEKGTIDSTVSQEKPTKENKSESSVRYKGRFSLWNANDQYFEVFNNQSAMQYVLTYDMRGLSSKEVNDRYSVLQSELASQLMNRGDYKMKETHKTCTLWEKELRKSNLDQGMLKVVLDKIFSKNSDEANSIRLVFILH